MLDASLIARRLAQIEAVRAHAADLIVRVHRETMKARLQQAVRHLDEAEGWLNNKDFNTQPLIVKMVDAEVRVAMGITAGVQGTLDTYGPDAEWMNR